MTTLTSGAITRYRVLAMITGVNLLVLCFVVIPLQVFAHNTVLEFPVSAIHGYGYLIYLVAALDLCLRARFSPVRTILIMLAGTIPFGAFYFERIVVRDSRKLLAESEERKAAKAAKAAAKAQRAAEAAATQVTPQAATPEPASAE
jgi:integral membrane protein